MIIPFEGVRISLAKHFAIPSRDSYVAEDVLGGLVLVLVSKPRMCVEKSIVPFRFMGGGVRFDMFEGGGVNDRQKEVIAES